jgi:cell wall-associated NlpC family hydrolase
MPRCLRRASVRALPCPDNRRRPLLTLLLALGLAVPVSVGPVGPAPRPASALAASPAGSAIRWGLAHLGAPYRYGGTGPAGYDCSGFTRAAYAAAGVDLPHSSRQQYLEGARVPRSRWQPGDLIYWSGSRAPSGIYHVGIYVGGHRVLHQTEPGDVARITTIFTPGHVLPYATRPAGLRTAPLLPLARTGDPVRTVQLRLRANGHAVAVTGVLDAATLAALRRFQARHGIGGDGTVDEATWNLLLRFGVTARPS